MLSEVLINEYNRILSIAFMMVDNDADAQDLIQDLAEKILRKDVPATNYEKPLAYFSKIMRNKRRDDLRARARAEVAPPETIDTFTTTENVESTAQYHQVREIFVADGRPRDILLVDLDVSSCLLQMRRYQGVL